MSGVIKKGDSLLGVRYWAQWYENRIPRYEVFVYVGTNPHIGLYYFQSIKQNALIHKNYNQLDSPYFRPFLLDINKVNQFMEDKGYAPF